MKINLFLILFFLPASILLGGVVFNYGVKESLLKDSVSAEKVINKQEEDEGKDVAADESNFKEEAVADDNSVPEKKSFFNFKNLKLDKPSSFEKWAQENWKFEKNLFKIDLVAPGILICLYLLFFKPLKKGKDLDSEFEMSVLQFLLCIFCFIATAFCFCNEYEFQKSIFGSFNVAWFWLICGYLLIPFTLSPSSCNSMKFSFLGWCGRIAITVCFGWMVIGAVHPYAIGKLAQTFIFPLYDEKADTRNLVRFILLVAFLVLIFFLIHLSNDLNSLESFDSFDDFDD